MGKLASGSRNRSASPRSSGVLLVNKPAGVTSHDVVAQVRRTLPRKTKVGHAGTLDPFATGLLLILVGKATRAQRFLMALPKTYRAVARLGWTSTTGDPEGELTHTGRIPDDPQIETGDLMQRPHAFSAVKVGGKRAYELARAGEDPELEERPVTVYRAERLSLEGERAEFEIECSSGTYVRQLVVALEDAYCAQLERTAIGEFRLANADPDRVVPLADALAFLPERALDGEEAAAISHGRRIAGPIETATRLTAGGELLAIGRPRDGEIQPDVVFVP
jgi:tRNA pseudouridine55 synthase